MHGMTGGGRRLSTNRTGVVCQCLERAAQVNSPPGLQASYRAGGGAKGPTYPGRRRARGTTVQWVDRHQAGPWDDAHL